MVQMFSSFCSSLGEMWCQAMHSDTMWPVKGEYQCKTCLRKYRVAWEPSNEKPKTLQVAPAPARISAVRTRVA